MFGCSLSSSLPAPLLNASNAFQNEFGVESELSRCCQTSLWCKIDIQLMSFPLSDVLHMTLCRTPPWQFIRMFSRSGSLQGGQVPILVSGCTAFSML